MGIASQGTRKAGTPLGPIGPRAVLSCLAALALLTGLALALAFPVPAAAANHTGKVTDPSGDGPEPARDLVSAEVSYDPATGAFQYTLETAGPPDPTETAQFTGAIGRYGEGGTCTAPAALLATVLPGSISRWMRDDDGQVPAEHDGEADRRVEGNRIVLSGTDQAMKGITATCAVAIVADAATGTVTWDQTDVFPVREVKVARLQAKLQGVRAKVRRGGSVKAKVRISNPGNATARGVRLKIGLKGRGTVRPKARKLGAIGPGKARTVAFRVSTNRRSKGALRLTARASAGNAKAAAAGGRIKVQVPRRKRPAPSNPGGLAGKLFWGFESYQWDRSSDVFGLHFVNRKFVHLGMPKGGLATCGRATAKVKDGKLTAGCVRYSYNARTGKVRIGSSAGTYRKGKLKLKLKGRESDWAISTDTWYGTALPKAGAKLNVKLINRGYQGLCGLTPFCTTWQENLTLKKNGQFGRQKSSLSTSGGPGLPFVAIHQLGPDERGRYQVLSRSRIRFRYASGKVQTQTIAIQLNKRGPPDAAREGVILDDTWFYRESD